MLPLLSNTDLIPTSDNDRKRTRSPLITENETLIDNYFTDSDSQSENLNLNRAQNDKSRKFTFLGSFAATQLTVLKLVCTKFQNPARFHTFTYPPTVIQKSIWSYTKFPFRIRFLDKVG